MVCCGVFATCWCELRSVRWARRRGSSVVREPVHCSVGHAFMIAVCEGLCRISGTILHKRRSPGAQAVRPAGVARCVANSLHPDTTISPGAITNRNQPHPTAGPADANIPPRTRSSTWH
jgi:hypothetical protein